MLCACSSHSATQTSSPGSFQPRSAGLAVLSGELLLLTGMAAKIPAVLPEPSLLFLWAFVGRGGGAKAQF